VHSRHGAPRAVAGASLDDRDSDVMLTSRRVGDRSLR